MDTSAVGAETVARAPGRLVVSWAESDPTTLENLTVDLDGVDLCSDAARADVVHVSSARLRQLPSLRRSLPGTALVLDLRGDGGSLGRVDARRARAASAIVVSTESALEALRGRHPSLGSRAVVVPEPVAEGFAPLGLLKESRDSELKRFRRLHRLAGPVVLYAGAYEAEGGLDVALAAVTNLRAREHDVRLAAIPEGRIDGRYLARCEQAALTLGHRAVVEWGPPESDRQLWYALATIVCSPCRSGATARPAQLAAAAARPFVASALEPLAELVEHGETGVLIPPADADALAVEIERLIADEDAARRLGQRALERAEAAWSSAAVARRLRTVWFEACNRGQQSATGE